MGRKPKIKEKRDKIIQLLREGNTQQTAAEASGISTTAFHRWMNDERPVYVEFQNDVKEAKAAAEAEQVANIRTIALDGTWTASAWWLERRRPDRWGKREPRIDEGDAGKAEEVEALDNLSTEEQATLARLGQKAAKRGGNG